MRSRKLQPWIACSLDGLEAVDGIVGKAEGMPHAAEDDLYYTIIEIKTMVSGNAVAREAGLASADLIACEINSPEFEHHVPAYHAAQIVHNFFTLNTVWFFYICASESQILYTVLSSCSVQLRNNVDPFYSSCITPALSWAHFSLMGTQALTGKECSIRWRILMSYS